MGAAAANPVFGEITGANRTADALQSASDAQLAQQRADRKLALEQSPEELQALQDAITTNTQDIARKQKLLDSSDPALIEAGKQATQLLQGKAAASIAPLENQRAQQRSQLEQTLAKQLGGDYATSSAGIQALNNFDQQTSNILSQAQQQTLGSLLGVAQNTSASTANLGSNISAANSISVGQGQRKLSAINGTNIDPGLAFTGDISKAKSGQALFGQILGAGIAAGSAAATGGGSTAAGASGGSIFGKPTASAGGSYTDFSNIA